MRKVAGFPKKGGDHNFSMEGVVDFVRTFFQPLQVLLYRILINKLSMWTFFRPTFFFKKNFSRIFDKSFFDFAKSSVFIQSH